MVSIWSYCDELMRGHWVIEGIFLCLFLFYIAWLKRYLSIAAPAISKSMLTFLYSRNMRSTFSCISKFLWLDALVSTIPRMVGVIFFLYWSLELCLAAGPSKCSSLRIHNYTWSHGVGQYLCLRDCQRVLGLAGSTLGILDLAAVACQLWPAVVV